MTARLVIELELVREGFRLSVSLQCSSGRLALLGPSGAGKTTVLRSLAGLVGVDVGRIEIDGTTLLDTRAGVNLPPHRRRVGLVTQQGSLFPHLSLRENLVFALRCLPRSERPTRSEARERAQRELARLGLCDLAGRLPGEVSGGEARRAELARTLITRPRLVLLDEPFSALDPKTKAVTEAAFRESLGAASGAWVLVTHDRLEALGLAEEVGILVRGEMLQMGRVQDVFFRPATQEVAEFLGGELAWEGQVVECDQDLVRIRVGSRELLAATESSMEPGTSVMATLRPEDVTLWAGEVPVGGSSRNHINGRVVAVEPRGLHVLVRLDVGIPIAALLTRGAAAEIEPIVDKMLGVSFKATRLHLIPRVIH